VNIADRAAHGPRRWPIERNSMQFVSDYMKAIDFIALAALVVIGVVSFYRQGSILLLVAAIVVAIWGASRVFGLF
jgi:hypothetical protein